VRTGDYVSQVPLEIAEIRSVIERFFSCLLVLFRLHR
jgi:hypothetical protein